MNFTDKFLTTVLFVVIYCGIIHAQNQSQLANDATTPLHALQPDYPTPYDAPEIDSVKTILNKVYNYLNRVTPAEVIDKLTNHEITDISKLNIDAAFAPGDFRLISYEWGVTYACMMLAAEITRDQTYTDYTAVRLKLIAELADFYRKHPDMDSDCSIVHSILHPRALDDAGAML